MMTFKIILENIYKYFVRFIPLFLEIYFIILGIIWISIYIFFRIFSRPESYTLDALKPLLTVRHYFSFSFFILIHIIILCSILFNLFKKDRKYTNNILKRFMDLVKNIMDNVLWKPLDNIHELIAPNIPGSGRFFLFLEQIFKKNFNEHKYFFHLLIFIFNIFPKVIVSIVFFIDIVLLGSFKYFIYIIPLLLVPILFNIFLKSFESFATRNIPVLQVYFSEIKYVGDTFDEQGNLISSDPAAYEFHVKSEYSHADDIEETIKILYQLNTIVDFVIFIKGKLNSITPYVTLFTSSIYLLGGVYRIYYLICI